MRSNNTIIVLTSRMIRLELRSLSTALLRIASGSNHSASEHYQESCYCSSIHYQYTFYIYFTLHHLHQLNETFLVELFNQDGSKQLIEEPSSVNLTITENDDPHGVFSFVAESLNVAIGEFRDLPVYPDSTSCCWSDLINCCTMGPIRVYFTVCVCTTPNALLVCVWIAAWFHAVSIMYYNQVYNNTCTVCIF